jgi:polysaccharide export outer membrane protein
MVLRLISQCRWQLLLYIFAILALSGCNGFLPGAGPTTSDIVEAKTEQGGKGIQVIDVTDSVARTLKSKLSHQLFSELLPPPTDTTFRVGVGDAVEVMLWEAPPAALFGVSLSDLRSGTGTARAAVFPEQMVSKEGTITVPFVGQVRAAGRTLRQMEEDIENGLKDKANQPQVLVRLVRNMASNVTLVGEMGTSTRMPLTPKGERLLDALAAAGGVRQPVHKMTMQITRGDKVYSMPLESIIRDPRQNIILQPGDVITALYQPFSLTVLGATGKNEEINFEVQGITLAQSLARSAGLQDMRADAQGVFIFRFEDADALDWPFKPVMFTPEKQVPVVYRLNLRDPASFLVAQNFQMKNKDVLYVSNAPATELQKFLNLLLTAAYPALNTLSVLY